MKRFSKYSRLLPLLLSLLILGGSLGPRQLPRYVNRAEVILYQGSRQQVSTYLQPHKIQSVLTYLRLTKPRGKVDPDRPEPDSHAYRITLHYSDGSKNVYYLQDYQYFSKNGSFWQRVGTTHAQMLYPLLHLLPTDV